MNKQYPHRVPFDVRWRPIGPRFQAHPWHFPTYARSEAEAVHNFEQNCRWHNRIATLLYVEHPRPEPELDDDQDDDPQCVCGVYRSEHRMMGCREGFQTAAEWDREREFIRSLDDDEYERIYGWD